MTHVEGEVNPIRDLDIINEELRLKDEEYLGSHLEKLERTVLRGGDKKLKPEYVSSQENRPVTFGLMLFCYIDLHPHTPFVYDPFYYCSPINA